MNKLNNILFSVVLCITLAFIPIAVLASNNTSSIEINNNTSEIPNLKESNTATKAKGLC
jgi:hypothetical protein